MKKLIILFLILSILVVGCKSYTQTDIAPPTKQNPSVGGGCGAIENEKHETIIKYVKVETSL